MINHLKIFLITFQDNMNNQTICSQNDILLKKNFLFYYQDDNLNKMLNIINGSSKISLRIVDSFQKYHPFLQLLNF